MALRSTANFLFGPDAVKIIPLNADLSTPLPLTGGTLTTLKAIGGLGPFDFSGPSDPAAIEFRVKINATEDSTTTIDLTGATAPASITAVTATELVAAITAAAFTNITATVDSRGYVSVAVSTPGSNQYIQVYGEGAEIAMFGQGYGSRFILVDTQQSISQSPTLRDAEEIVISDSKGLETRVIADQYRRGSSGAFVDTARDNTLRAIIEGGIYDTATGFYHAPTSEDAQIYFAIEIVRPVYLRGDNKAADISAYYIERIYSCTGSIGDDAGDRNFSPITYNYIGTSYVNPEDRTISSDYTYDYMEKSVFQALDWDNI